MKEMAKIVDNTKPYEKKKTAEEKQYLICISARDGGEDMWCIVTGRTDAYEFIKNCIEFINFEESFILVESCTLAQRKSIYAFMKYAEQFYEDSFDIDDYVKGDWSEEEYKDSNEIDDLFALNKEKVDMTAFMNGEITSTSLE